MTARDIYNPDDDIWVFTGYDGYYVSDTGHVWGPGQHGNPGLMKARPGNKYGHLEVSFKVNGERIHKYVHRLVAEAFIPNPYGYPLVRHLDDDPTNNCVENLEWGTQADNMRDAIRTGSFRYFSDEDREAAMEKRRMPIKALNIKSGAVYHFESQQEASRQLGINQTLISDVISGKKQLTKGYIFVEEDEEFPDPNSITRRHYRTPIRATNIETGGYEIFPSQAEASRTLGISAASISFVLSGRYPSMMGYSFKFEEDE